MEFLLSLLMILFMISTIGILLIYYYSVGRHEAPAGRGVIIPPGSQGMPFVGETFRLIAAFKSEDPEPFMDDRVRRHGRLFTSHVFGERTIFSADPEFNRQVVLAGEGRTFEGSYPSSVATLLGRHSLVLMKGPLHKRTHSLTLTRFASLSVLKNSLLPDIDLLVRQTFDSWSQQPSLSPSPSLSLLDQAKKVTFELTVKQLMSRGPGEWTDALRKHYLALIDGFFSIPLLPSFLSSSCSFTTYGRAIHARRKVAEELRGVIRKRRQEQRTTTWEKLDMLDELMEEGYAEEEMVDFMLALLVSGYETTPTVITLVVKFLTENPHALQILKEEHDGIRARKMIKQETSLEWSDYKSMPFTQCVINETLRVANIVSGVFRRAMTDVHFKGYTIPKGCKVFASFRAVHLDPENFKDARTFNPWRWQKGNDDDDENNINGGTVFTPFGGGPRLCPGYELARLEISVFLHHFVTRFSWDVAEKDKLVHFPTTRTLKGYPIIVRQRQA